MKDNKLETIKNLFEGKEIRSVWNNEEEEYYFSVVDVIGVLTDSPNPRNYWKVLKHRMIDEGNETVTNCNQLKMLAQDGKMRETDTLDTEGIFRLIESVPSPKAEPFKMWLASLGRERVDEVFDPEKALNRAIGYYRERGYSEDWIEKRLLGIFHRKKLTDAWSETGVKKGFEYAVLTNEIYKTWSGKTAKEYKEYKGLRKESLRDNMSDTEIALTDLSEIATRELVKKRKPNGFEENKEIAHIGGNVAKLAKDELEKQLGESVVTKENNLDYSYVNEKEIE